MVLAIRESINMTARRVLTSIIIGLAFMISTLGGTESKARQMSETDTETQSSTVIIKTDSSVITYPKRRPSYGRALGGSEFVVPPRSECLEF